MSTSKDPERKPSTFDDIIHTNPLLFRLHSPKFSHTFFDDDSKILFSSSRNRKKGKYNSEDIFLILKALEKKPTAYETSTVARHITTWQDCNKCPSDFISLTYNFSYVLWEWKCRRHQQLQRAQSKVPEPEDDFHVIVFDSSGLKGRAKLGIEIVDETQNAMAYSFARAHNEVIVADFIQPPTVLGAMSLSQLEGVIPSWYGEQLKSVRRVPTGKSGEKGSTRFTSFVQNLCKLKLSTNEDDGAFQSLRFALELLAPILARGDHWHQHSAVDSANRDRPRNEGRTLDWSSHDTTSEALSAGAAEDSPTGRTAHPPKRRKLAEPEEEQCEDQDIPESVYAEQGGNDPERLRACKYIRAILADIWYMEGMGESDRQAIQETCTDDVDKLLKRYIETIEKYVLHVCWHFHP
jgi:hypothetical protein